jgi:demethylmenaquinone methyltransferase/2-methoxy-6-polyprenyl-1,4-benzoquinol methylase
VGRALLALTPASVLVPEPVEVERMFARLAPAYDRFNRISSLGLDALWRRRAAARVRPGDAVLDVGCGTGDLSLEAARRAGPAGRVTGADPAEPMLVLARKKAGRVRGVAPIEFVRASAEALPFPDATFDAVVSAFVLRSLAKVRAAAAAETARVLKPGGVACWLELTRPAVPLLRGLHRLYLERVIPVIGRLTAGDRWPGGFLASTVLAFPEPREYAGWFASAGLRVEAVEPLWGGLAGLVVLRRP